MWRFGLTISNVPSVLIVQTVPSEVVHVPASAAGPERGVVTQAVTSAINAQAKMIRRECCIFMATILCGRNWGGQAANAAKANVRRVDAPAGCKKLEFKLVRC